MSDEPPTPPSELPVDVVEAINECSPELLRRIARYAEELAEYRERMGSPTEDREGNESEGEEDEDEGDLRNEKRQADLPEDVPSKATITVKEINDNRYYYWQWRDGDKVRSRYKGPVGPDE